MALGIASIIPFATVILLALFVAVRLVLADLDAHGRPRGDPIGAITSGQVLGATELAVLGAVIVGIAILELILGAIFAVLLAQRSDVSTAAKIVSIVLSLLIGYLALPVIWLVFFARRSDPRAAGVREASAVT